MSRILFGALFDDAAIFPPGNVPMDQAVRAHLESLDSPAAAYIGPFVCSDGRLDELQEALGDSPIQLALTTNADHYPGAVHTVLSDARFTLRSVEIATHDVMLPVAELPSTATAYLELPWGAQPDLPPGTALKLRTGGETSDAFPTEDRLAHALGYCVAQDIRFKLTAGLHNAIRHTDPVTGFEHHGFLNVILAVLAALGEAHDGDLAEILANRDADEIADGISTMNGADIDRVRHYFRSFGTCSTSEPINDLYELGLLQEDAV
ncbi:MAG: hypothetical protein M3Q98_03030 [Actinomycetota bacterium]|nr:hypothetical protein [Actinomycetota bacterium]